MPVNGKRIVSYARRLGVSSSASGSHSGDGTGAYTHSAIGYCGYTPDVIQIAGFVSFQVSGSSVPNTWSCTYTGPGAPLGVTYGGSGWSAVEAYIEFTSYGLYNVGGSWRQLAGYSVVVQGTVRMTGSVDLGSAGLGPAYPVLGGIPWTVQGSAGASTTSLPSYGPDDPWSYSSNCTATVLGYDKRKETSTSGWFGLPVTLAGGLGVVSAPSTDAMTVSAYSENGSTRTIEAEGTATTTTCACTCGSWSASNTTALVPPIHWKKFKLVNVAKSRSGSVMALPDVPKRIKRFNSDFRLMPIRFDLPQTTKTTSSTSGGITTTTTTEVHPHQSYILGVLGDAIHAMEDTFSYPSYAPSSESISDVTTTTYSDNVGAWVGAPCPKPPRGCPPASYFCTVTIEPAPPGYPGPYPNTVDDSHSSFSFPSSVGPKTHQVAYLRHDEPLARYINSWPNPHWTFFVFQEAWEVDGSSETWNDYWKWLLSQWVYNAALPSGEQYRTRNHLASEGGANNQNQGFHDTFTSGHPWVGINSFLIKEYTPLTSYTYTNGSSSLWSGTNCTLAHGADIVATPSGSGSIEIALALGSFTVEPYLWPHLADRITADWSATNVSDCKVYLEGQDGSRVLLSDNEPGVAKSKPKPSPVKYAGSYKQDYGALIVTDEGVDDLPAGVSAGTMGDPEKSFAFQLLADRTASKLVYVITPTSSGSNVTVHYPLFEYTKSATRKQFQENAHQVAIVHPDGPGVRLGQWDTGSSGTINNPPAVMDGFTRQNSIDWRVAMNLCVLGKPYDYNITSDLSAERDTYETQSVGGERSDSYGYLLPPTSDGKFRVAIVSSLAETPPLAQEPVRGYNIATGARDGDYCQETWVHADQGKVVSSTSVNVVDGSVYYTTPLATISGWIVAQLTHSVTNSETDSDVVSGTVDYGTLRPWRGFYWIGPPVTTSGGCHMTKNRTGLVFAVSNTDERLELLRFDPKRLQDDLLLVFSGASGIGRAQVACSSSRSVIIVYDQDGTVYSTKSESEGELGGWSVPVTVASGLNPAIAIDEKWDVEYVAVFDTDRWKLYSKAPDSSSHSYVADIYVTSGTDSCGGLEVSWDGSSRLVFVCHETGIITRLYSTDQGKTWNTL